VEFTNVKCTSADVKFINYEVCRLKSVNRTYKYVSIKLRLYKLPITNATVRIKTIYINICTHINILIIDKHISVQAIKWL